MKGRLFFDISSTYTGNGCDWIADLEKRVIRPGADCESSSDGEQT
jgi:hypothetical protein